MLWEKFDSGISFMRDRCSTRGLTERLIELKGFEKGQKEKKEKGKTIGQGLLGRREPVVSVPGACKTSGAALFRPC